MSAVLGLAVLLGAVVVALLLEVPTVVRGAQARRQLAEVGGVPRAAARAPEGGTLGIAVARTWQRVRARLTARRVAAAYDRRLLVALEALARALRAGTPLATALRTAADAAGEPVASDLLLAVAELDHGRPTALALRGWLDRRPVPGVRLAVASLVVGTELGGSRARAVDRVAAGLRERVAAAREVVALASQARLSAIVIAVAPLLFAALGVAGNRDMARFLVVTPAGWACALGGAALDVAAAWWMVRIVDRAAR